MKLNENNIGDVKKSLHGVTGIDEFTINDDKDSIIVNTTLPFTTVQNTIEETHGVQAVLKGYTGTTGKCLPSTLGVICENLFGAHWRFFKLRG